MQSSQLILIYLTGYKWLELSELCEPRAIIDGLWEGNAHKSPPYGFNCSTMDFHSSGALHIFFQLAQYLHALAGFFALHCGSHELFSV
jgi:hypothetical protein